MAWFPIRCDLHDDPAVVAIATTTRLDADAVVGKLLRLWAWANVHTVDGRAAGVPYAWVDRLVAKKGFAAAMEQAGWLAMEGSTLVFPNFDRWNQTAKARLMANQRKSRSRSAASGTSVTKMSRAERDTSVTELGTTEQKQEQEQNIDGTRRDDLKSISSSEESEQKKTPDFPLEEARRLAKQLRVKSADDRGLIMKLLWLRESGRLSEHELADAIAAVVTAREPPRRPLAYLHTVLDGAIEFDGRKLNRLLAAAKLPATWLRHEQPPEST